MLDKGWFWTYHSDNIDDDGDDEDTMIITT
jgi:hypothetical protein